MQPGRAASASPSASNARHPPCGLGRALCGLRLCALCRAQPRPWTATCGSAAARPARQFGQEPLVPLPQAFQRLYPLLQEREVPLDDGGRRAKLGRLRALAGFGQVLRAQTEPTCSSVSLSRRRSAAMRSSRRTSRAEYSRK